MTFKHFGEINGTSCVIAVKPEEPDVPFNAVYVNEVDFHED